jgi:hypothetical protein
VALVLTARGSADAPPAASLHLAVCGLTMDYVEPCGCGGQNAGGLARRATLLAELRRAQPDLIVVDPGLLGSDPGALPVTARSLAAMGVDGLGLADSDLEQWPTLAPLLAADGLSATTVTPLAPAAGQPPAPPRCLLLGAAGGPRLGLVAVSWGALTRAEMMTAVRTALAEARRLGASHTALAAHLTRADAEKLLAALPDAELPELVLLATEDNFPRPPDTTGGVTWVPVAQKGRSLSVITLAPGRPPAVEQRLVGEGPRDPLVQGWVDDYNAWVLKGEHGVSTDVAASFPRPAACVKCHGAIVERWRAHPHSHAVETLIERKRDTAACLRCHDERLRRDGVRSDTGDRGVECASCHDRLAEHVDRQAKAATPGRERCLGCHSAENSPHFDYEVYLKSVREVCRADGTAK